MSRSNPADNTRRPALAFVVQRYGLEVIGGAEAHCRQIAERLQASGKAEVTVLTTTAREYQTWSAHYPAGSGKVENVRVLRFPIRMQRSPLIFKVYKALVSNILVSTRKARNPLLRSILQALERFWFVLQGPWCPDLLAYIKNNQTTFDHFFFFTYLYYPTVYGLPLASDKATIVPTAHPELPFRFPSVARLFNSATHIFANTSAEGDLIRQYYPDAARKIEIVGAGVDSPTAQGDGPPVIEPYVLYLGRLTKGKGVDQLLQYFMSKAHAPRIRLVLAGEQELTIPSHPDIVYLGTVSNSAKSAALCHARALINPSPMESLSLIVLEAMAHGTPVIANGICSIHQMYAKVTRSVFTYQNRDEFLDLLNLVSRETWKSQHAAELAQAAEWTHQNFDWAKICSRYLDQAR